MNNALLFEGYLLRFRFDSSRYLVKQYNYIFLLDLHYIQNFNLNCHQHLLHFIGECTETEIFINEYINLGYEREDTSYV